MDILEKLFGNSSRVKLLRLFLFNPGNVFTRSEIVIRSKVPKNKLSSELSLFKRIKFIKEKKVKTKIGEKFAGRVGFEFDASFPLGQSLKTLLNSDFLRKKANIVKRFKNCGRLKLVVLAGMFLDNYDGRIDLFIVGDQLKKKTIDGIIKTIEADIGRELSYSMLETEDFLYRLSSSDKFIRDVFDYPHERVIDKIGI